MLSEVYRLWHFDLLQAAFITSQVGSAMEFGMERVGDPNQYSPSLGRKDHIEIRSPLFSTAQGTRLVLSASSSGRRGEDPTSPFRCLVLGKMTFPTTWNVSKPKNGI